MVVWSWLVGVVCGAALVVLVVELGLRAYLPQVRHPLDAPRAPLAALAPCDALTLQWRGGFCRDPHQDLGLPFEDVVLTADGAPTLRGWWIPPASPGKHAVLFAHGAGNDRREGLRFARTVHDAGFGMLLLDLRNHGLSDNDGRGVRYGVEERWDVARAARHLKDAMGMTHVVAFGMSMGAVSSIYAAAQDARGDIDAVIAEAPFANLADVLMAQARARRIPGELALAVLARMKETLGDHTFSLTPAGAVAAVAPRPLLLFSDGRDELIPPRHADVLFREAREPKHRVDFPTATHALGFNTEPDRYRRELRAFLDRVTSR